MIVLQSLSKVYENNGLKINALHDVNLHVEAGDIFGVIGLSGAGKSTLIRTVNYLEKPTEGTVKVGGKELGRLSVKQLRLLCKNIGMIFQHFNLLQSKTIYQNVAIPLVLNKEKKDTIRKRVMELLTFVGLADKAKNYPNELSGGQKQRVGIARALATNPSVLLCDEATSALDPQTTESILQLLKKINREYNITILMITHEMDIIKEICNRVAVMEEGEIVEYGEVTEVFGNPQHETTKRFIQRKSNDIIPINIREEIVANKKGRIAKINLTETTNDVLNDLIKNENVAIDFLYSTMNESDGRSHYMLIRLRGEGFFVQKAFTRLKDEHLLIEEVI